jgi:hypothetical protein
MHFLPMRRFWLLMRPTLEVLDDEDARTTKTKWRYPV